MASASPKNPSTLIFWNDLENDERLRTCSLAAKGLWDHHMLPIAARSDEPGVVLIGDHPCKVAGDLPKLLARVAGESPDVIAELLRELVDSGAASVDDRGRAYNRRMVREEAIRKVRSAAGKRGAEATNSANLDRRQKSGKHPGKGSGGDGGKHPGKPSGKQAGKNADTEQGTSADNVEETSAGDENDIRQNAGSAASKVNGDEAGDTSGKTTPSSLFMLQASSDVTNTDGEERGRTKRRRTKLPDDWAIDDELRSWTTDTLAATNATDRVDVERELPKFKAHHIGKGNLMLDWSRAWHTWIFNAIEWSEKHGSHRNGHSKRVSADTEDPISAGIRESLARRHLLPGG